MVQCMIKTFVIGEAESNARNEAKSMDQEIQGLLNEGWVLNPARNLVAMTSNSPSRRYGLGFHVVTFLLTRGCALDGENRWEEI